MGEKGLSFFANISKKTAGCFRFVKKKRKRKRNHRFDHGGTSHFY